MVGVFVLVVLREAGAHVLGGSPPSRRFCRARRTGALA